MSSFVHVTGTEKAYGDVRGPGYNVVLTKKLGPKLWEGVCHKGGRIDMNSGTARHVVCLVNVRS